MSSTLQPKYIAQYGNPARSQSKWPLMTRLLGEPQSGIIAANVLYHSVHWVAHFYALRC
jgi:hypothetical protein